MTMFDVLIAYLLIGVAVVNVYYVAVVFMDEPIDAEKVPAAVIIWPGMLIQTASATVNLIKRKISERKS